MPSMVTPSPETTTAPMRCSARRPARSATVSLGEAVTTSLPLDRMMSAINMT